MCSAVRCADRWYKTPRQLAQLVGGLGNIVWEPENPSRSDVSATEVLDLDMCLCAVDLGKTLDVAGYAYRRGTDPMEWYVEEKTE